MKNKQPVLTLLKAGQQAIAEQNLYIAKAHLIEAAHCLTQHANRTQGVLRNKQARLARRLYQQADKLQENQSDSETTYTNTPSLCVEDHETRPVDNHYVGISLSHIIGHDDIKRLFISKYIYPLKHRDLAKQFKQTGSGGTLLYGPPGTGKTMLVRALAGEMGVPVVNINPASILSKWLGESEKQLADIFSKARQLPAALIFIDEIDALATNRNSDNNGAMQRLLTQLLIELDGFHQNKGHLMFLAATNRPWDVDVALLRTGRFDSLTYVSLPNTEIKRAILRESLDNLPCQNDLNLQSIASKAVHFSGAEMYAIGQLSARLAFMSSIETDQLHNISQEHLIDALEQVHRAATPELLDRYQKFSTQIKIN